MKKRLVVPSRIYRRRSSWTATYRGERYAFAFCRDHLTELYATERGAPWKVALRLSSYSPGARLSHDRIGREPDVYAPAITHGWVTLSQVRDSMTLAGNVASAISNEV